MDKQTFKKVSGLFRFERNMSLSISYMDFHERMASENDVMFEEWVSVRQELAAMWNKEVEAVCAILMKNFSDKEKSSPQNWFDFCMDCIKKV